MWKSHFLSKNAFAQVEKEEKGKTTIPNKAKGTTIREYIPRGSVQSR